MDINIYETKSGAKIHLFFQIRKLFSIFIEKEVRKLPFRPPEMFYITTRSHIGLISEASRMQFLCNNVLFYPYTGSVVEFAIRLNMQEKIKF